MTGEPAGGSKYANMEWPWLATCRKGAVEPCASFAEVAPQEPEPTEPPCQPEGDLGIGVEPPVQGRPQVVVLGVEPVEPHHLLRTGQLGFGLLGQRQEEFGMCPPRRLRFTALRQPLQPVLPDRLQHHEAWLAIRPLDRLQ